MSEYVVEFGEGWQRIGNAWYALPDLHQQEEPEDEVTIPEGYIDMGMVDETRRG